MSYMNAMQKLDEVIVGAGGQASIAFSSIDQRYRSLRLHFNGAGSVAANNADISLQLNGDTAANYDWERGVATGTSALAANGLAATAWWIGQIPGTSAPTSASGSFCLSIVNYAGTSFRKVFLGQVYLDYADLSPNKYIYYVGGNWRSTAAITSILLFPTSGNFVQGSVCSLYGVL